MWALYAFELGKWCPKMVGEGRNGLMALATAMGDFVSRVGVVGGAVFG